MGLFDQQEKDIINPFLPKKASLSKKRIIKFESRQDIRKETAREILDLSGGIPEKNASFDCITNGQSNAGGFYEVIRDEWGDVNTLCVATWIINRYYIDVLLDDIKSGRLKEMVFILSNRMSQLTGHKPHFNYLKSNFPNYKNIFFRVCNSHAKTYSMTNGTDYVTVDGSGNWSENPRIENYTISNIKEKFDFRKKWMMDLING